MQTSMPTFAGMRVQNGTFNRNAVSAPKHQAMMPVRSRPCLVIKAASHPHGAPATAGPKSESGLFVHHAFSVFLLDLIA